MFRNHVEKIQVSLKSDKNDGTLHDDQQTFVNLIFVWPCIINVRKVIQKNQLDATIIYWSIRAAQHVWGNILPIIRSVRLKYLQHTVACKDGYTESYVVSYVICRYHWFWWRCILVIFVFSCRFCYTIWLQWFWAIFFWCFCIRELSHRNLHNFLYIHLCRIPYAVNISVSRSWWWAKYCPKHVELIL